MYNAFFGLQKAPFELTQDPEFLFLTTQHREALAGLTYAILARKGFVVLTGNAGTGKTTLLTRILGQLPASLIQTSVIVNPTLTPAEFLETALMDFGFRDIPVSKAQRIAILQQFLWKEHRDGKITALIIDEAHKLSLKVLEEIRLLGNFESATDKLLQIVLVGQSELDQLLNRENLRQFKQRIALRLTIQPLSETEVEEYIRYRWMKAGGKAAPFSADAIASIAQASQGVPRVISVVCDNALIHAFGGQSALVEASHVLAACEDLQLPRPRPKTATVVDASSELVDFDTLREIEDLPKVQTAAESMTTLMRYETVSKKPSRLARLAGKFNFMQRTKSA